MKRLQIDKIREDRVFGLFPEFRRQLKAEVMDLCIGRLKEMDLATAGAMINTVPREWEVTQDARIAWAELIYRRAGFVADNIEDWIEKNGSWFGTSGE